MAMRIYLLGYMASGKSSFGKLLAARTGFSFLDLDVLFEERFRISIPDFFQKYDETAFRQIERELLIETTHAVNSVIATGGGTPCYYDNLQIIKRSGVSVYLEWKASALAERLRIARKKRPLMKNVPPDELDEKVRKHLAERVFFYRQADLTLQADKGTTSQLIEQLVQYLDIRK